MIVVTGLGAVTSLGQSSRETWERLIRGERGFGDLSLFDTEGYRTRIVAQVPSLAQERVDSELPSDASRTSELGLVAAREALEDAGFSDEIGSERGRETRWKGLRAGLVMGGSTAGMLETESVLAVLIGPEGAVDPVARKAALTRMLRHPLSAPTERLARALGPFSRVRSISSACSSGANAVIVAATWLELGLVDVVLCGAADALCRITMSGFNALAALDPDGARPFDRRRKGLTLGEGAGFLVLERKQTADARHARAWCTLLGWASRSEAHHITNPEPTGEAPVSAMNAAIRASGLVPADVDFVNAHGTGTRLNDPMESRALARVFGDDLPRVPVTSCKGQIGHTLGASGAIEAVVTALAVARDVVPPTGGLEEPDPECPLHHVTASVSRPIRAALSSSFGFGGMDAVLVFGKARPERTPAPPQRVVITGASTLTPDTLLTDVEVAELPERPSLGASVSKEMLEGLDPQRARRLDRTSRLAALTAKQALGEHADPDVGIVLGSAFGAVDGSAAFMRRLEEKGPRLVSPAEFPSLVPSSPAGFVSIYLGLRGPSLVVADLAVSGECAVAQAFELVAHGQVDRILACAVEERSAIVEQVLSVLFGGTSEGTSAQARREGSSAVALASSAAAKAKDLPILAELATVVSWVDASGDVEASLASLGAPPEGALVVHAGSAEGAFAALARSPWASCPRISCADHAGTHEAVGGMAVAVAAAKIARGDAPAILCVGSARGSGYGVLLRRWTS